MTNEEIPKFDSSKFSNFIENDKILIQDIKKKELKNSTFSNKNVKNGFFQSSLDTIVRIQNEEKNRRQLERKPTSTKGQFDEKSVWQTNLGGGSELEEMNIDTMGTNLFSSSKPLFSTNSISTTSTDEPIQKIQKKIGKKKKNEKNEIKKIFKIFL